MKSIILVCAMTCCSLSFGNEWVPYRVLPPAPVVQLPVATQYPVQPVYVVVPLVIPYIPVVTYDSVLIEQKQWCLFKRYEIINVPRVNYVPVKY